MTAYDKDVTSRLESLAKEVLSETNEVRVKSLNITFKQNGDVHANVTAEHRFFASKA